MFDSPAIRQVRHGVVKAVIAFMRVPTNGLKIVTFGLNIPVKTGRVVPYETVETRGQILWRAAGVGAQLVLKTKLSERITVRLSCFPPFYCLVEQSAVQKSLKLLIQVRILSRQPSL